MSNKNRNMVNMPVEAEVEGVEVEVEETTTEVDIPKKEKFAFVKKHAAKIKAGMILVGCTVAGAALGMKIQSKKDAAALEADIDSGILEPVDVEAIDIPDTPVDIEV